MLRSFEKMTINIKNAIYIIKDIATNTIYNNPTKASIPNIHESSNIFNKLVYNKINDTTNHVKDNTIADNNVRDSSDKLKELEDFLQNNTEINNYSNIQIANYSSENDNPQKYEQFHHVSTPDQSISSGNYYTNLLSKIKQ